MAYLQKFQFLYVLLLAALMGVSGAVESYQGKDARPPGGRVGETHAPEVHITGPRKADRSAAGVLAQGGPPGAAIALILILARVFGQDFRWPCPAPTSIWVNTPQTLAAPKTPLEEFPAAADTLSKNLEPEPAVSKIWSQRSDLRRLSGASTAASTTSLEASPEAVRHLSAVSRSSFPEQEEGEDWDWEAEKSFGEHLSMAEDMYSDSTVFEEGGEEEDQDEEQDEEDFDLFISTVSKGAGETCTPQSVLGFSGKVEADLLDEYTAAIDKSYELKLVM
jgi:hypothetical protein